jgi:hypothetical protein
MNSHRVFDKMNINDNQFTFNDYLNHNTIVIQSCTAIGKITATAKHIKEYLSLGNNLHNYTVLSIISRRTLGDQHITSFKQEGIELLSYEDKKLTKFDHGVICLNSLLQLDYLTDSDLRHYIVYIDEINSFIEHTTHNETINKIQKQLERILNRIVKHCHKLILSDLTISDNVFAFIKHRKNMNLQFIRNDYVKYKNINAFRMRNENTFLSRLVDRCKKQE